MQTEETNEHLVKQAKSLGSSETAHEAGELKKKPKRAVILGLTSMLLRTQVVEKMYGPQDTPAEAAARIDSGYIHVQERRDPNTVDGKLPKAPIPKGMHLFNIDGVEVWALNYHNAVRKAAAKSTL